MVLSAGKCHGSAIGRGDFKLSLYGGTPAADYDQIVRQLGGRRVHLNDPQSSLIFMKPAEFVEHGGGTIIDDDDNNAQLLLRWIQQGAKYVEHRQLKHIEVTPRRFIATKVGERTPLKVVAHYDDGLTRDVTNLTQFIADDSSAVTIDADSATASSSASRGTSAIGRAECARGARAEVRSATLARLRNTAWAPRARARSAPPRRC